MPGPSRSADAGQNCCCLKLGTLVVGVLVATAMLFGVSIGARDFWKLPKGPCLLAHLGLNIGTAPFEESV